MPTAIEAKIFDSLVGLFKAFGPGALGFLIAVLVLWFCWKLVQMHRTERKEWMESQAKLHEKSLDVVDKNTRALTELSTIVKTRRDGP